MTENKTTKFEKFLSDEYTNIATAHFKSIDTISSFFRYYLLIMSIPLSVLVIILQNVSKPEIFSEYKLYVAIIFICISFVGLGVLCYIINLRMDAILYARTVNGIRKYFYDNANIYINLKNRLRVLPQSPQLPLYWEKSYFFPVVIVFGIINSIYFGIGISGEYWISSLPQIFANITTFVFFILHFFIYKCYSDSRELFYLKSNIIGVDIDGVLNKHREHFCKILYEKTQKKIKPEEIIHIPVNEIPNIKITREDERKVFNSPEYWINMPPQENASDKLLSIYNSFRMKIYLFTYRHWPDTKDKKELLKLKKEFLNVCKTFYIKKIFLPNKIDPMKQITIKWLKKHNFFYNKIIFEKGNDYSSDSRIPFRNRFYFSRNKKIRFFVEDDIEKAIKLSVICDIVFLISHPYNEPNDNLPEGINRPRKYLPNNIIRVKNWEEIYRKIRELI